MKTGLLQLALLRPPATSAIAAAMGGPPHCGDQAPLVRSYLATKKNKADTSPVLTDGDDRDIMSYF
jgi:hypothetical protein